MAAEQLMDEMKVMRAQLNLAIIHLAAHAERIPSFWINLHVITTIWHMLTELNADPL